MKKKQRGLTYAEIAEFLPDRKPASIKEKARTHPLIKTLEPSASYSKNEEELLVSLIQEGKDYQQIANRLQRTKEAIKQKAFKMGLAEKAPEAWAAEEDELLEKEARKGKDLKDILHLFPNRSVQSLYYRCFSTGIKVTEYKKKERRARKNKKCKQCKLIKDVDEFYIDSRYQLPGCNCKECHNKLTREYELENPEKVKARRTKWVEKNRGRIKLKKSEYYFANLERERAVRKLWREKNKEHKAAKDKEYYLKNKEKIRRYFNETWKPKNLEKMLEKKREYYQENKGEILKQEADRKRQIQKEKTAQLIQFYKEHEIPEYKWHKSEFALEEDFQSALAHALVNKFDLNVELEVIIGEFGRPDIYLPDLDLFLEIKLTSFKRTKKQIVEQVAKYNEVEETWIVCLDTAPEWAIETSIPWFTPDNLFGFFKDFNFKA